MEGGVVEGRVELGVEREVRAEMQGGTVSVQHRPGRRRAVRTEREQPGGERRPQRLVGQQRVHAGHQVNTADSRDNNTQIQYQTSSEQHIGICDKVPFCELRCGGEGGEEADQQELHPDTQQRAGDFLVSHSHTHWPPGRLPAVI